jgi:hypothetical protein
MGSTTLQKTCPSRLRLPERLGSASRRSRLAQQALCAVPESKLFLTQAADQLMDRGWIVDDDFDAMLTEKMREQFVARFHDPLKTSTERFIWDYWYVPNQYALMRTTAEAFFDDDTYQQLERRILEWAGTLGLRQCSPMWLSYYVDGHAQELHTDAPHGPFAFVLSLTDWPARKFTGGETQLLKQELLNNSYWASSQSAIEVEDMFDFVEPQFNRLTVFDPRIPHGVRQVRGVRDPREGRLVVHGWFTEPSPFFEGDIDHDIASEILNDVCSELYSELSSLPRASGVLIPCLTINAAGDVECIDILSCTLQFPDPTVDRFACVDAILEQIEAAFDARALFLPALPAISRSEGDARTITLPFVFD